MNDTYELSNRLTDLARSSGGTERERRRAELERVFGPVVRLALRTGGGPPHVVRWVRQTRDRLARTNSDRPPREFATEITRLLFDRVLERIRSGADTRQGHWSESLVGV